MARIGNLKVDLDKEAQGAWLDYESGVRFRVASISSPAYREALRSAVAAKKADLRALTITEDQFEQCRKAAAWSLLTNWENIENDKGVPMPFSEADAKKWAKDPELHLLWDWVLFQAEQFRNFRKAVQEDVAKN
jgi:hypothetical protein